MSLRFCFLVLVVSLWASTVPASVAFTQAPVFDTSKSIVEQNESATLLPNVEAKREDAAEKLRVAQKELDTTKAANPEGAAPPEERVQDVNFRDRIERVLAQQQDAERRKRELQSTCAELEGKIGKLRESIEDEPPPRSFLRLDEARDELEAELEREDSIKSAVSTAGKTLERAKLSAEDKDRRRHRAVRKRPGSACGSGRPETASTKSKPSSSS